MARSASHQPHPRAITRRRYPLWRLVRANLYDLVLLLRESWVVLVGFLIVVFTGTLYLIFYEQKGLAVALYETLKLLTLQSSLAVAHQPARRAAVLPDPAPGPGADLSERAQLRSPAAG